MLGRVSLNVGVPWSLPFPLEWQASAVDEGNSQVHVMATVQVIYLALASENEPGHDRQYMELRQCHGQGCWHFSGYVCEELVVHTRLVKCSWAGEQGSC